MQVCVCVCVIVCVCVCGCVCVCVCVCVCGDVLSCAVLCCNKETEFDSI